MHKVRFIALGNTHRIRFQNLTELEKIDLIEKRIVTLLEDPKNKTSPDTITMIGLPEYAITSKNTKPISSATKRILKSKISALTKKYPNLVIFAGTASTRKETTMIKSKEILSYYKKLKVLKQIEATYDQTLRRHRQIDLHEQQARNVDTKHSHDEKKPLIVRRNTCYYSYKGEVYRLDKMGLYEEIDLDDPNKIEVFKPGGKEKNTQRLLKIKDQNDSKDSITVGLEICREHDLALLEFNPFIHLIISNPIELNFYNMKGKYTIHLDTCTPFRMLLNSDIPLEEQEVEFFENDLLENTTKLVKIEGIYPFRTFTTDQIKKALIDFKTHRSICEKLEKLDEEIYHIYEKTDVLLNKKSFKKLKEQIKELSEIFNEKFYSDKKVKMYFEEWFSIIIKRLDQQFVIEIPSYEVISDNEKKLIDHTLKDYQESRRGFNFFRNSALIKKKTNLSIRLRKKITSKEFDSKNEARLLLNESIDYINVLDEQYGKNSNRSRLIKDLKKLEKCLNEKKTELKSITDVAPVVSSIPEQPNPSASLIFSSNTGNSQEELRNSDSGSSSSTSSSAEIARISNIPLVKHEEMTGNINIESNSDELLNSPTMVKISEPQSSDLNSSISSDNRSIS